MILADFLEPLFESGRPVFASAEPPRDLGKPAERTARVLAHLDRRRRLEAPGTAPDLDRDTAHAAACALCRLAQFTVFREIPAEAIDLEWTQLSEPLRRGTMEPRRIWSADLSLMHLPNLFRMARSVAENDPLMRPLRELAKNWPLSGVGIDEAGWEETDFAPVIAHPGLAVLLVDRVFEHRDRTVASLSTIRPLLDTAVGEYGKTLAPWLSDLPSRVSSR